MRILAIRGENLASLASRFEIDLAAEPIAGSGLFAITGETGAGKSTILDALCLALYGQFPRTTVGRRENAPDPSGEPISASDGRAILRRGAGGGYAEVDFIGQDGEGYRARWEANRARGRANGRLQNEQRALYRLDDGSAVAAGKTQVKEAVEARTDLTFEQFRRTVLLAQGEFDAFLLAAEGERAELLEKITGTEIYAAISIQVRAGTDKRRATVERLEFRRNEVGPLDAEARQALLDERSEIASTSYERGAARDRDLERLEHVKRVVTARDNLNRAEADASSARLAREAAADDYRSLAEFDLVEPLRPLAVELRNAQGARAEAESRLEALSVAREDARLSDAAMATELATAVSENGVAEKALKDFLPVWSEAERLDTQLAAARTELADAIEKSQAAEESLRGKSEALATLDRTIAEKSELSRTTVAELDSRSGRDLVLNRLADALDLLTKRKALAEERSGYISTAERATAAAETMQRDIVALSEQAAEARAQRLEIAGQATVRRNRLAIINDIELRDRDLRLQRADEILRNLIDVCGQHDRATVALKRHEADGELAIKALKEAEALISQAELDRGRHQAARTEIIPIAELADEAVSSEALHLRSLLAPTLPCPVCGSTDHPHLAHPSALNEMAERLRQRRGELDRALIEVGERLDEATRARAAAEVRQAEARRGAESAREQVQTASATYSARWPSSNDACLKTGMERGVPSTLSENTTGELDALGAAIGAARRAIADPLAEAQELRTAIDAAQRELDALDVKIGAIGQSVEEKRPGAQAEQLKAADYGARAAGLAERLVSIGRELAPFLAVAGFALDKVDADPAGVAAALKAIAEESIRLRQRADELEAVLQNLGRERAAASTSLDHARAHLTAISGGLDQRRRTEQEKARARAAVLGGEATATHRARISGACEVSRETLARARARKAASEGALQAAAARCDEATSVLEMSAGRSDRAERALGTACQEIARSTDQVVALITTDPGVSQQLRGRVQSIDRALNDANAAVLTRRSDLDRTLEGFDETVDPQALAASVASLAQEIEGLQQRAGALTATLARDDVARQEAANLAGQIDAANTELAIWQAVDDAIGSANGDRFRRFAQGVTLDHMVQLANEHLDALTPRYRLARDASSDLTLHVIDRDMGDEVRGTRSLSGGERFLVSLALALALSGLEGRSSFVDTLFIDEGFGSLDAETLDLAVDALESLQGRGRKVGIITHVAAMIERIAVQVRVEKRGAGRSEINIVGGVGAIA